MKTTALLSTSLQAKALCKLFLATIVVLLATSCSRAGARGQVYPELMGAAQHRQQAARHERKARVVATSPSYESMDILSQSGQDAQEARKVGEAARARRIREHNDRARQHRQAAGALDDAEDAQCRAVPARERAVCPLKELVARTEEIENGIRIFLVDDGEAAHVVAHIRCHHAHGRTIGFEGMSECPLYIKRLEIHETATGVVELTSRNKDGVSAIKKAGLKDRN